MTTWRRLLLIIIILFPQLTLANQALFDKALSLQGKGQLLKSQKILWKLIKKDKTNDLYWFNLGNNYVMREKYKKGIRAYKKVVALKSPLAPVAQLYWARILNYKGNKKAALRVLNKINSKGQSTDFAKDLQAEIATAKGENSSPQVAKGLNAFQEGRYNEALTIFDEAISTAPSLEAHMMRGLTHLKLNNENQGRQDFLAVIKMAPDSDYAKEAQDMIHQINNGLWRPASGLELTFDVSGGFVKNYYASGDSVKPLSQPLYRLGLNSAYNPLNNDDWRWGPRYKFNWEDVMNFNKERIYSHAFSTPLTYSPSDWVFELEPEWQYFQIEATPFILNSNLHGLVSRQFGDLSVGLATSILVTHPQDTSFSFFKGTSRQSKLFFNYNLGKFVPGAFVFNNRDGSGDQEDDGTVLPFGNQENGLGVSLSWYPSANLEVGGVIRYSTKDYWTLSQPDSKKREDTQFYTQLSAYYSLLTSLRIYFSMEMTLNSSTLESGDVADRNYSQIFALGGLQWDLLP